MASLYNKEEIDDETVVIDNVSKRVGFGGSQQTAITNNTLRDRRNRKRVDLFVHLALKG